MKSLLRLTIVEMKLYLREPMATFFTLAYAPMLLILFGFIYGNDPTPFLGGRGFIDTMLPAYIALIIVTVGLMSVPIATAEDREKGILRRFYSTPTSPAVYLFSNIFVYYLMTLAGVVLLFMVGKFIYNAQFEGNILSVLAAFTVCTLSFFSFGYLIASLAPTARTAQIVGMVIAIPMMFLSGAAIPLEVLTEKVTNISKYIPLYYVVHFMKGIWIGNSWSERWLDITVLMGILVVGVAVSVKTFKWE
ncbi:MAG: ABC transporter permease [Actinomycetia bacterium]|nr:ABC transporter permease [Actinomycetes bacterium]